MDSLTTETRAIGDTAGLRGQLSLAGRGRAVGLYRALQTTRGYCGVAIRRQHQPMQVPAKDCLLLRRRTAASGPQNRGAAVQLSCADAIRRCYDVPQQV